jgi:hypothetical protein
MEIIDDQPEKSDHPPELDGLRIRQLTALRRGAIRSRSWCLITAAVCIVGTVQLLINIVQVIRYEHSLGLRAMGYLLVAIGGCIAAIFSIWRAQILKREIDKPLLDEPKNPPDFSTLSDGSERWKSLENIE